MLSSSVQLDWTPNINVGSYLVYYRKTGITTWTLFGAALAGATALVVVTGLLATTEYEFYIVSSCTIL